MKIFCVGRNYADHAKELNNEVPTEPVIFMKPDTALLREDQPLYYPSFTQNLHYELELVVRIQKPGKKIEEKFAHKYYEEITVGIDFTARDKQDELKKKSLPWELAKAFDHSAVVGRMLPKSGFGDLQQLSISMSKNGTAVQEGNTKDMLFSIDRLISFISQHFTLRTGDLIFTGTPQGVGPAQIGDLFEGYLQGQKLFECAIR